MSDCKFWKDKSLSWKAKGLLAYLNEVNKNASIGELLNASKDQRTAVHTGLKELKKLAICKDFP